MTRECRDLGVPAAFGGQADGPGARFDDDADLRS